MNVSLILPCYNPPQDWEKSVFTNYNAFCDRINNHAELIIVIDGVSNSIEEEQLVYLQQNIPSLKFVQYAENKGKGYALRRGVSAAKGEIILYTDIDFPYTIDSMFAIYNDLQSDLHDVAIGIKNETYYTHIPPVRKAISQALRVMIKAFLALPVTDTQCGLKGFKSIVKPLFLKTTIDRYLFDLEFIRNCYRSKKYRIQPIPIALNNQVHFRKMNYRILLPELLNFAMLLTKKPNE
jgi:glycosyltransferase involved in cell wall biosynthesis